MAKRCKISPSIVAESEQRSYVLKVDGYTTAKKQFGTGKYVVSAPFSAGGYNWVMNCYPNGMSTKYTNYISVYLFLDSAHAKDVKVNFTLVSLTMLENQCLNTAEPSADMLSQAKVEAGDTIILSRRRI